MLRPYDDGARIAIHRGISAIDLRRRSPVIADRCISIIRGARSDQVIKWNDYLMMRYERQDSKLRIGGVSHQSGKPPTKPAIGNPPNIPHIFRAHGTSSWLNVILARAPNSRVDWQEAKRPAGRLNNCPSCPLSSFLLPETRRLYRGGSHLVVAQLFFDCLKLSWLMSNTIECVFCSTVPTISIHLDCFVLA